LTKRGPSPIVKRGEEIAEGRNPFISAALARTGIHEHEEHKVSNATQRETCILLKEQSSRHARNSSILLYENGEEAGKGLQVI